MMRSGRSAIVAAVIVAACAAASAETGMKTVMAVLESRYAVHPHGVPGLWLTKPFLAVSGLGSLKIAEFGNFRPPVGDGYVLKQAIEQALGPEWSPFVESWSKSDGEWSVIFVRTMGEGIRILIVCSDHDDGLTLLQVNVSGRAVRFWLDEPARCAKRVSGRHSKDQDRDRDTGTTEVASDGTNSSRSASAVSKPREP